MPRLPAALAALLLSLAVTPAALRAAAPPENKDRPTIVPIPASVAGMKQFTQPVSDWRSPPTLDGQFWAADADTSAWTAASGGRGGRGGNRGATPSGDFTSAYRAAFTPPADWTGKRIVLRFDSVGDGAKLWVNGQFVRDHWGSLMPFSADITDLLHPDAANSITLGQDQRPLGLNAFVRGGGISGATLIALPTNYLSRLHADTTFDTQYKDATLHVWLGISFHNATPAKVALSLKDPSGKELPATTVELSPNAPEQIFDLPVISAIKWDPEHPNLYTLTASLLDVSGAPAQTLTRQIGLRQIELRGNQLFANGQELKLRGIWGGSVQQAKNLNANHSRQKWVTQDYLEQADKEGLWVLDENPIDFAKFGAESDPRFAYQWMSFVEDLIERDRDHPSVLLWGLGNESFTGPNVQATFRYASLEDPARPTTFSFANRVPVDQPLPYSVYSSHYPDMANPDTNLAGFTVAKWHSESLIPLRNPVPVMPVLNDEYGHTVQNRALLTRDPNVRSFWGESLKRYWEKMFTTQGSLGGDIFGLTGGFGATGNEPFFVYQAYSPIRIDNAPLPNPGPGKPLSVPIKNWFDHSNLNEITVAWAVGAENGTLHGPDLAPHAAGALILPARDWKDNDQLSLKFTTPSGFVVNSFLLPINPPTPALPKLAGPAPTLTHDGRKFTVTGDHFKITFDQYRGLIDNASYDGHTVLTDGPFLNLLGSGLSVSEWVCDSFDATIDGDTALISLKGNYAVFKASFQIRIDGHGLIATTYTIDYIPGQPPPPTFSPWDATSVGGYSEVGVSYMLPTAAPSLSWQRKALYSIYPDDNIGRAQGTAQNGSDDFRSTKEYILRATVDAGTGAAASAISDGRDSVRLYADTNPGRSMVGGTRFCIDNLWNYPDIGIGNWCKPPLLIKSGYSNTVYLQLGPARAPK